MTTLDATTHADAVLEASVARATEQIGSGLSNAARATLTDAVRVADLLLEAS